MNVGGADSSQINTNIGQRYDTIYFDQGTDLLITIQPQSELGRFLFEYVRFIIRIGMIKGLDRYGSKSSGESFTVKLKDGRNIIEVRLEIGKIP